MFASRQFNLFLGLLLVLCVVSAPFLHAVIPHKHSHAGGEGVDIVWASLHSGLHAEDRKAFDGMVSVLALFALCASFVSVFFITAPAYAPARRRPDRLALLLKRGILPYRAFP